MQTFKGWFMIVVSSLILLAAIVLLLAQASTCDFSVFWSRQYKVNVNLVMLFSAVGGMILLYVFKMLIWGVQCIRREQAAKVGATPIAPTTAQGPEQP